ncbi:unnamed protein product [Bursaphelenchus xylophilus]|uniref:(pine wood nematode) hypothetical protein n=1 Tax=Bursaphelenchus xylophilus TaxID=6326 RepID=A0A1I7SUH6_BURXY|nr:unnamed protein product [Bursaphelenchus xylophilus]CAG9107120.1 unnamed protein product [Bursaphelenchus xylophilus]
MLRSKDGWSSNLKYVAQGVTTTKKTILRTSLMRARAAVKGKGFRFPSTASVARIDSTRVAYISPLIIPRRNGEGRSFFSGGSKGIRDSDFRFQRASSG